MKTLPILCKHCPKSDIDFSLIVWYIYRTKDYLVLIKYKSPENDTILIGNCILLIIVIQVLIIKTRGENLFLKIGKVKTYFNIL